MAAGPDARDAQTDPRPWGYMSARAITLARGDRCDLSAAARLVLLSGSARLAKPGTTGEVVSAFSEAVILDGPRGEGCILTALTPTRLVLFSAA